jgi:hypothetical protein
MDIIYSGTDYRIALKGFPQRLIPNNCNMQNQFSYPVFGGYLC